jgi:hypothetical protein
MGPQHITPAPAALDAHMVAEARSFKRIAKGNLLGLADVELAGILLIHQCPILRAGDRIFVALPQRPKTGRDDKLVRDHAGKVVYESLYEWTDRAASDAFTESVLRSLIAQWGRDVLS